MGSHASCLLVNEVMPRFYSAVPNAVRPVGWEDHQELCKDGALMAAKMLVSGEKAGKKVTARNVVYYTIEHLKSCRRSVGNSCTSALSSGTQMLGQSSIGSMDKEVAQDSEFDAPFTWNDLISMDTDDPAQKAMRRFIRNRSSNRSINDGS